MSWFGAFRNQYGFILYPDNRTPVTVDMPLFTVTYLCVLLAVATLISTLGIRGRERWATTLRASYAVGIGSILLVCLVGHNWLEGSSQVTGHYLYRSDFTFEGSVGLRISLHGCNVTLDGYYKGPNGRGHVYYAESMQWTDYGKEQETLGGYLQRGLPHPVLAVMDFLSVDSGGMRWGRHFHSSGYFACALLWTAFAFWIISNVLLLSVVSYGSFMFFLTGVAMVLSCVVYHVSCPPLDLRIRFGEHELTTHYGWCFWLALIAGIVTAVLGALLWVLDHLFHEKIAEICGHEKLDEDDDPIPVYIHPRIRHSSLSNLNVPGRRASHQPTPLGARKPSIFLEADRRPSDMSSRKSSLQYPHQNGGPLGRTQGISNKGFELDKPKSNPLFSGSNSNLHGVPEHEVRVDIEMEEMMESGGDHRGRESSPSREQCQNRLNEQQLQQTSPSSSVYIMGDSAVKVPSSVVVHRPSDRKNGMAGTPPSAREVREEGGGGEGSGNDSAFTSAGPSPVESEKGSTCGDNEDHRL